VSPQKYWTQPLSLVAVFATPVEFSLETIIERLRLVELVGSYDSFSQIRSTQI